MKIRYILFSLIALALFPACKDDLMEEVKFGVEVKPADGLVITDSLITAPKGTRIRFDFSGEPDFISFSYKRFIPSETVIGFATYASWGTHIENTLNVFISDSFEGLALDNFTADSTAIAAHAWTDISGSCNLPVSANVEKTADFSLDNYKGKKVVLAFRYKPEVNTDWQPGWEIRNLQINNVLATDGSVFSTFLAANLSFSPFDMLNPADPYNGDASLSGIWIVEDPTRIQLKRTARGYDLNHDWLVSRPFTIPSGFVEESDVTPVKNISSNVGSYAYTFSNTGEYTLRFKASNYNYKSHSSVEKTMVVKITE